MKFDWAEKEYHRRLELARQFCRHRLIFQKQRYSPAEWQDEALIYDARPLFNARGVFADVAREERGEASPTSQSRRLKDFARQVFNNHWPVTPIRVRRKT